MSHKPISETQFRVSLVMPFLKTLRNTVSFTIQQLSITGHPDLLLCMAGRFVALELKADKGKVRPLQKYFLDEIKKRKGIALVACPGNWETTKRILTDLDGGKP